MPLPLHRCRFESQLFRVQGPGGWVFAPVPEEHAPAVTLGWGRTPVHAGKDDGDLVEVELEYSIEYTG